jgi:hypothetical protein
MKLRDVKLHSLAENQLPVKSTLIKLAGSSEKKHTSTWLYSITCDYRIIFILTTTKSQSSVELSN